MKPAATMSKNTDAKEVIFAQRGLLMSTKRTAWWLFEHELTRVDPYTGKLYTPHKALDNALKWLCEQYYRYERIRLEPTQLQRTLLQMLVDGKSQKQIAYELHRNHRTVRVHFDKLRERVGAESLYQVIALATKKRWVKVPDQKVH
jgi:DNA-binding CsgD family transcriptional regulator